ncbi:MAG: tetratricopeptide repeat protein, partial [Myxococcota bacterium]
MALRRRKPYDRTRILAEAAQARKRGRHRKALGLYRQVLEVEPTNANLHRKVAPLLARGKETEQAWESYRQAAQVLQRQGFSEQAIGLYREASRTLPTQVEVWQALA